MAKVWKQFELTISKERDWAKWRDAEERGWAGYCIMKLPSAREVTPEDVYRIIAQYGPISIDGVCQKLVIEPVDVINAIAAHARCYRSQHVPKPHHGYLWSVKGDSLEPPWLESELEFDPDWGND